MRAAVLTIVLLLIHAASAAAQSAERPYYTQQCSVSDGFWVSYPVKASDEITFISFPERSAGEGRLKLDRIAEDRRQWSIETLYRCSVGAGHCQIFFDNTGSDVPYVFDVIDVEGRKILYIENIRRVTTAQCRDRDCTGYMNKTLFTRDGDRINHAIPSTYYLYDCMDNPAWEFEDLARQIEGRDSGEITYESGSCVLKAKGIHFGFRPSTSQNRNARDFPPGDVIVYSNPINNTGTYFALHVDGELVGNVGVDSDNGYLGEYHYISGSLDVFRRIAAGSALEIRKDRKMVFETSLKGSAQPVREFLNCVARYD